MFMKNYKKSVATLMTTITLFAGLHGNVFAEETTQGDLPPKAKQQAYCEDVYNDSDMRILSCKISNKDYIIARKKGGNGGITVTQVK